MSNILQVQNLSKSYGTFALKDVSFEISEGYIMGFIGPNGAGKTTTIKSILNMVGFSSGEINVFGLDNRGNAEKINEQIGVVMDSPFYVDDWTAKEVEGAVSPFYSRWSGDRYAPLLKKFDIDKKKKIKELSRGMRVKLMLAVALSHDAKLLILDEPTSGLDPVARDELCDLLGEFVEDESRSVLFSTHITSDLEKIADFITFILNGEIVFSGVKEELLGKYALVKGDIEDLDEEQERLIIGMRRHGGSFDGMAGIENIGKLSKSLLIEAINLEEIIIFMNRGGKTA